MCKQVHVCNVQCIRKLYESNAWEGRMISVRMSALFHYYIRCIRVCMTVPHYEIIYILLFVILDVNVYNVIREIKKKNRTGHSQTLRVTLEYFDETVRFFI